MKISVTNKYFHLVGKIRNFLNFAVSTSKLSSLSCIKYMKKLTVEIFPNHNEENNFNKRDLQNVVFHIYSAENWGKATKKDKNNYMLLFPPMFSKKIQHFLMKNLITTCHSIFFCRKDYWVELRSLGNVYQETGKFFHGFIT